jgi:hypothetical protein
MEVPQRQTKPRMGCLPRGLLVVAFLFAAFVAAPALFAPWGFFLGGRFHMLPWWQGWGRMHSPAGDYVVFVEMSPRPSGSRILYLPSVGGTGAVCTPRGQTFRLRLRGGFHRRLGSSRDTNGEEMSLSLSQNLNMLQTNRDTLLRFSLQGIWRNPDLVMDDRGTIARAFNPDGTLYAGDPGKRPPAGAPLQITLQEGSRSDFDSACAAAKSSAK